MARRDQTLYRDTSDKMIAGVCSGLGHYFDIDTTLVRVVFIVFTAVGGSGVLLYLVLWLVLSPAPLGDAPPAVPPAPAPSPDRAVEEAPTPPAVAEPPVEDDLEPAQKDEPSTEQ